MKKVVYIAAFTLLGLLLATIVHAGFELPLLHFVFSDYETYGESLIVRHWDIIHGLAGAFLWVVGAAAGFLIGQYYWQLRYETRHSDNT